MRKIINKARETPKQFSALLYHIINLGKQELGQARRRQCVKPLTQQVPRLGQEKTQYISLKEIRGIDLSLNFIILLL